MRRLGCVSFSDSIPSHLHIAAEEHVLTAGLQVRVRAFAIGRRRNTTEKKGVAQRRNPLDALDLSSSNATHRPPGQLQVTRACKVGCTHRQKEAEHTSDSES